MGEDGRRREEEITAIRARIDLGMTLIDTAEMDGDGTTEALVGEALSEFATRSSWSARSTPRMPAAAGSSAPAKLVSGG